MNFKGVGGRVIGNYQKAQYTPLLSYTSDFISINSSILIISELWIYEKISPFCTVPCVPLWMIPQNCHHAENVNNGINKRKFNNKQLNDIKYLILKII